MTPVPDSPFSSAEASPWAQLKLGETIPRVALIGVSGYAQIYLNLLKELIDLKAVKLEAVVIINQAEERAVVKELEARGCRIYSAYKQMLEREAGKIDLCFIPTGIPWHAPMTIDTLNSGANVLVEKPLAGSLADASAIREAEKRTGRWVAVGFQDLYPPQAPWLKEQILAGLIGPVRSIRFVGMWPRGIAYYRRNNWAGRLIVDGRAVYDSPLSNAFGHFVNLVLYFAGPTANEAALTQEIKASLLRTHSIESFDTAIVTAKSLAGIDLVLAATHVSRSVYEPEIEIQGDLGKVRWSHESTFQIQLNSGRTQSIALPNAMDARRFMFANVLRKLKGEDPAICDTAIAERHAAFIRAINESGPISTVAASRIDWTPFQSDSLRPYSSACVGSKGSFSTPLAIPASRNRLAKRSVRRSNSGCND